MQAQNEKLQDFDQMLSLREVAKILGVCGRSVRRLVGRGEFPRPVRVGRALRV
jgi:predicted DNA-binding transcriptional regulator AlpA